MRVLFSALPAYGHIYPLIPLALAARDLGHEVQFATAASFLPALEPFGLKTLAAGIGVNEAFAQVFGRNARSEDAELHGRVWGLVIPAAFVDDLRRLLERAPPDLVVYDASNVGAFLAARLSRVPGVCHGLGRPAVEVGSILRDRPTARAVHRQLVKYAQERGVELPPYYWSGDPYLDICPPSFQNPAFTVGNRFFLRPMPTGPEGTWSCPRPEPKRRSLIYVTFGTVFAEVGRLRRVVAGLATMNVSVLVSTGPSLHPEVLSGMPDNVRVVRWVSHGQVLPRADLVVHHGGSGTMLGALCCGLPQLVLPLSVGADSHSNAEAVATAGVGIAISDEQISPDSIVSAAKELLAASTFRAKARAIADEIARMPEPSCVASTLIDLARAPRPLPPNYGGAMPRH